MPLPEAFCVRLVPRAYREDCALKDRAVTTRGHSAAHGEPRKPGERPEITPERRAYGLWILEWSRGIGQHGMSLEEWTDWKRRSR